jgi:hypothetical protein
MGIQPSKIVSEQAHEPPTCIKKLGIEAPQGTGALTNKQGL